MTLDSEQTGTTLEALVSGSSVLGVLPDGPAEILSVVWHGTSAITVTVRGQDGNAFERVVLREDENKIRILYDSPNHSFDGNADDWRLAAEALRIDNASYYDPMVAVTSSDLDPLPHQLRAVYEHMIPKTPLRFLLADDPGAGKTIMAGLYVKELVLRSDADSILIVVPGGLASQWQDELSEKFNLNFEILTRSMIDNAVNGDVFKQHRRLIARMDMLARDEHLIEMIRKNHWDVVIVDEAHRMSAHYSLADEIKYTKRYALGLALSESARNFVLMTATPHSGKPDDFQLFLALLDGDRFEGKSRDGIHKNNLQGIMRRMVKEDLLTMEGKALFPERRAYTVDYELSEGEKDLYEAVTQYVKEQMVLVQKLNDDNQKRRGNAVGFALTVLQRRLASSPEAILRSLERRQQRLKNSLAELRSERDPQVPLQDRLKTLLNEDDIFSDEVDEDELDEFNAEERELIEEGIVASASAARNAAELEAEIRILDGLIELARRVRSSGVDKKWTELRNLLTGDDLIREVDGSVRKIIIFTEHKDTLEYLQKRISDIVGDSSRIERIDGSTKREERKKVQERFMNTTHSRILLATDAAGEGLNLQSAHLMVNYDLPWNPNRLEQRFGRIHRIGQTEVCHLWNLVAVNTREGQVFQKLLEKMNEMRIAYEGKVFDVLGEAFEETPLRELLMVAVQYGDDPERKRELDRIIDETVSEGIRELLEQRALLAETMGSSDVVSLKHTFEDAQARRLQPYYIKSFFIAAFRELGGTIVKREDGRFEITHVPGRVIDRDRLIGDGAPVVDEYIRVTFDREFINHESGQKALLIAPGHPLMRSVINLILEDYRPLLKRGAVFVDETDLGLVPRLLVGVKTELTNGLMESDGKPLVVDRSFEFVEIDPTGAAWNAGAAPYLDYEGLEDSERDARSALGDGWIKDGAEAHARSWVIANRLADRLGVVRANQSELVDKTRNLVNARLSSEIGYWDNQHLMLLDKQKQGAKLRRTPDWALERSRALEARLKARMVTLDLEEQITASAPVVISLGFVLPRGLVEKLNGRLDGKPSVHAKETEEVDRRAVALAMRCERDLGRVPFEMPHNNKGFDIRSEQDDGPTIRLEVKGRIEGADSFTITRSEVLTSRNLKGDHRLVLVMVSKDGPEFDEIRYILNAFEGLDADDFSVRAFIVDWAEKWRMGGAPR